MESRSVPVARAQWDIKEGWLRSSQLVSYSVLYSATCVTFFCATLQVASPLLGFGQALVSSSISTLTPNRWQLTKGHFTPAGINWPGLGASLIASSQS